MSRAALIWLTAALLVRQGITFLHGSAHDALAVPLAPWQQAFVLVVIVALPFVALVGLWWLRSRAALAFFAAVIAAGMLFGLYFHFGPLNPDHVTHQPAGASATLFLTTAIALVAADLALLALCAAIGWKAAPRGR